MNILSMGAMKDSARPATRRSLSFLAFSPDNSLTIAWPFLATRNLPNAQGLHPLLRVELEAA